jgi:hypothetical protein
MATVVDRPRMLGLPPRLSGLIWGGDVPVLDPDALPDGVPDGDDAGADGGEHEGSGGSAASETRAALGRADWSGPDVSRA